MCRVSTSGGPLARPTRAELDLLEGDLRVALPLCFGLPPEERPAFLGAHLLFRAELAPAPPTPPPPPPKGPRAPSEVSALEAALGRALTRAARLDASAPLAQRVANELISETPGATTGAGPAAGAAAGASSEPASRPTGAAEAAGAAAAAAGAATAAAGATACAPGEGAALGAAPPVKKRVSLVCFAAAPSSEPPQSLVKRPSVFMLDDGRRVSMVAEGDEDDDSGDYRRWSVASTGEALVHAEILRGEDEPLGMGIGCDQSGAMIITRIVEGSPTARCELLQRFDELIAINGEPVTKDSDLGGLVAKSGGKTFSVIARRTGLDEDSFISALGTISQRAGSIFVPDAAVRRASVRRGSLRQREGGGARGSAVTEGGESDGEQDGSDSDEGDEPAEATDVARSLAAIRRQLAAGVPLSSEQLAQLQAFPVLQQAALG